MRLSWVGVAGRAYRSAIARTRAAKPAALLARPAAVGKLLRLAILRGRELRCGSEGLVASRAARRERSSRRQA